MPNESHPQRNYNPLYEVSNRGSVFGAGLGKSGSTDRGVVKNSHVVVNGGTINGDVYGGGNYGATGTTTNQETAAKVDILGGTMHGSVFGGSNNNGGGYNNASSSSTCTCSSGTCLTAEYYYYLGTGRTAPAGSVYYYRGLNPTGQFRVYS